MPAATGETPAAPVSGGATRMAAAGRYGILSPLVVDLDGNGVELKRRGKSKARFDMDGDGARDDTGWIGKNDGFLVVDRDGDGLIRSAAELSLLGAGKDSASGFDALGSLDSNSDGRIDSGDARFAELKIWRDRNGNGVSDQGEVRSLGDFGIASIGLDVRLQAGAAMPGGNRVVAASTFTRADGSTGTIESSTLAYRPAGSASAGFGLAAQAKEWLAQLRGQGGPEAGLRPPSIGALRSFDGVDQFSAAEAQAEAAGQDPPTGMPAPDDPATDSRLARIAQDMAGFGARSGDAEWRRDAMTVNPRFDYFA